MYIREPEAAGGMEYPFVRGYLSGAVGYIRKKQHDPAGYQNISFPYKSVPYGAP